MKELKNLQKKIIEKLISATDEDEIEVLGDKLIIINHAINLLKSEVK